MNSIITVPILLFISIFFAFQKLKFLSLNFLEISPKPLRQFTEAMHHMTTLNLSGVLCTQQYNDVLNAISVNMPHLKSLDISLNRFQAGGVQAGAIECLLPAKQNPLRGCPELVHLNLARHSFVTVELLEKILLRLPKLQYLKHALLMRTLTGLIENEINEDTGRCLRYLYSSWPCGCCKNQMYFAALSRAPVFTQLENITEVDIVVKAESEHFLMDLLMKLKKIKRLTLHSMWEPYKFLFPALKSNGRCLEYLHLDDLTGDLDLDDIMRTCPRLVELHVQCVPYTLHHQPKINTSASDPVLTCLRKLNIELADEYICSKGYLVSLLKSPCLEEIFLSSVDAMSDDAMFKFLSYLRAGYKRSSKLKTIYLRNCLDITEEPFVCWLDMEDCMLEFLDISSCDNVNRKSLKAAAERYPKPLSVFVN